MHRQMKPRMTCKWEVVQQADRTHMHTSWQSVYACTMAGALQGGELLCRVGCEFLFARCQCCVCIAASCHVRVFAELH